MANGEASASGAVQRWLSRGVLAVVLGAMVALAMRYFLGTWDKVWALLHQHWEIPVFLLLLLVLLFLIVPARSAASANGTRPENFRQAQQAWIAGVIIAGSLVLILLVGGIVLVSIAGFPSDGEFSAADKTNALKDVLFAFLPLAGTWVGTVLAFYFSANNFQAAAEQSRELYFATSGGPKGPADRPVREIMTRRDQFEPFILEDEKDTRLPDLLKKMNDRARVPLLHKESAGTTPGSGIGVIHKADLETAIDLESKKLAAAAAAGGQTPPVTQTLAEALETPVFAERAKAARVLKPDAPLREADAMARENPFCRDFFVSRTGSRDGAVMGWVTDTRLAEAMGLLDAGAP